LPGTGKGTYSGKEFVTGEKKRGGGHVALEETGKKMLSVVKKRTGSHLGGQHLV